MASKVTNNAATTIAGSINSVVTTINLAANTGTLFPTLSGSDWFYGTLIDASNNLEVVKVTARATDALTVTRGQDGTTARSYTVGDRFELRPTAALFNDKADIDSPSFTTKITTPAITLGSTALTATGAELNYVTGVTSALQTQINAKAPTASPTFTGSVDLTAAVLAGGTPIVFEGATANAFETSVVVTEPTADRTITIPDASVDLTKVRTGTSSLDGVWRSGTNAEQLAGSLTTVVCTPGGLASGNSSATSGYLTHPGNIIEQWGVAPSNGDISGSGNTVTWTFPKPFPTAVWNIQATMQTGDSGLTRNIFCCLTSNTLSTATFYVFEGVGNVQSSWSIHCRAIGN